jgi:uncharacterized protein (DUF779 family)
VVQVARVHMETFSGSVLSEDAFTLTALDIHDGATLHAEIIPASEVGGTSRLLEYLDLQRHLIEIRFNVNPLRSASEQGACAPAKMCCAEDAFVRRSAIRPLCRCVMFVRSGGFRAFVWGCFLACSPRCFGPTRFSQALVRVSCGCVLSSPVFLSTPPAVRVLHSTVLRILFCRRVDGHSGGQSVDDGPAEAQVVRARLRLGG